MCVCVCVYVREVHTNDIGMEKSEREREGYPYEGRERRRRTVWCVCLWYLTSAPATMPWGGGGLCRLQWWFYGAALVNLGLMPFTFLFLLIHTVFRYGMVRAATERERCRG
jgi:hypothetical protein